MVNGDPLYIILTELTGNRQFIVYSFIYEDMKNMTELVREPSFVNFFCKSQPTPLRILNQDYQLKPWSYIKA